MSEDAIRSREGLLQEELRKSQYERKQAEEVNTLLDKRDAARKGAGNWQREGKNTAAGRPG